MKTCPGCRGKGPFGRNKNQKDGLSYLCKACRRVDQKMFIANNPAKYRAMRVRNQEPKNENR